MINQNDTDSSVLSDDVVVVGDETAPQGWTEIEAGGEYTESEVTTMTTETNDTIQAPATETPAKPAKAPKAAKIKTPYPFESKAAILARVNASDTFMLQCLQIMNGRQTQDEQEQLTTRYKNRCGWMSSHAVNGGKLATKALAEGLDAEETAKARSLVVRYGKQLANHFRGLAIEANPDLAKTAEIFGV